MMDRIEAAKEFLLSTKHVDVIAEAKYDRIERLRSIAEKCTASYGSEAVQHSRNLHSMEDVVAKLVDMENEVSEWFESMMLREATIIEVIEAVPDYHNREAVRLHYLSDHSMQEIADELNVTKKTAIGYVHAGLESVAGILEERGLLAA